MDGHEGSTAAKQQQSLKGLGAFQFEGNCCSRPPLRIFVTSPDNEGRQITIDWTVLVFRDTSHSEEVLCDAPTCVCGIFTLTLTLIPFH